MVHYEVNEQARTVKAIISGTEEDCFRTVQKVLGSKYAVDGRIKAACKMPNVFEGVAKCHPDDTFDVDIGKRIALSRLLKWYHRARRKAYKKAHDFLIEAAGTLEDEFSNRFKEE